MQCTEALDLDDQEVMLPWPFTHSMQPKASATCALNVKGVFHTVN